MEKGGGGEGRICFDAFLGAGGLGYMLPVSVKRRLRTRGKMQRECKMQTAD